MASGVYSEKLGRMIFWVWQFILLSSVTGYLMEADADFAYKTPVTGFSIIPRILVRRYDGESDLNSEDYFLDLDYGHNTERSQFRFRGNYGNESARTAEKSGVDFEIEDPDRGLRPFSGTSELDAT